VSKVLLGQLALVASPGQQVRKDYKVFKVTADLQDLRVSKAKLETLVLKENLDQQVLRDLQVRLVQLALGDS
jgi:hypothetical protein